MPTSHQPGSRAARGETLPASPHTDELRLFVQPVVDLAGRHISGWEALVRWDRPGHGFVDPGEFLPRAERSGAIHAIGRWVLGRAVSWRSTRAPAQVVGINASAAQLEAPGFTEAVERALAMYRLPPHQLLVELTETVRAGDVEVLAAAMARLRGMGVQVAIDDAGCGFSDEALIRALPADVLKLDEALVGALPGHEALEEARRWVDLAIELGMRVVAEGVRTDEQARIVRALGCTWGQGDLYGAPVPAT